MPVEKNNKKFLPLILLVAIPLILAAVGFLSHRRPEPSQISSQNTATQSKNITPPPLISITPQAQSKEELDYSTTYKAILQYDKKNHAYPKKIADLSPDYITKEMADRVSSAPYVYTNKGSDFTWCTTFQGNIKACLSQKDARVPTK